MLVVLLAAALVLPACAFGGGEESRLVVIMYHSVCDGPPNAYVIPPSVLISDAEYLVSHGYVTVLPAEAEAFVRGEGTLPRRAVMLTFDDGHYNFLTNVLPVLEKYGLKAVLAVVGAYVDGEKGAARRSDSFSYLNAEELAEVAAHSSVEIANHSYRLHSGMGVLPLPFEDDAHYLARLTADLCKCDAVIADAGGRRGTFACPFGKYNDRTVRAVSAAGYTTMLTCAEKVNVLRRGERTPLVLGRFNRPFGPASESFFSRIERS